MSTSKLNFEPDGSYKAESSRPSYILSFYFNLADITGNGELLTNYVIGHKGAVTGIAFLVNKPVTTAAKLATLFLKVGATSPAGSVALTSANATPVGKQIAGDTIPTGGYTFSETDAFSIRSSGVTAFSEGSGYLLVKIQNLD